MAFNKGSENSWFYFLFKKRLPISLYIIIPLVVALIAFSSGFIALVLFDYFLVDNQVLSLVPFLKPEVRELLRWTKLETLGFTFLGAVAGIGIVYAILNPLRKILTGARQIAEGDFSGRLDIKGLDELGILGKDFNRMVSSLNEYFIDSMAGGWILLDPHGKIVSVNRGALNILWCESEDLVGKPHSALLKVLNIESLLGSWIEESLQNQLDRSSKELEAVNKEGRSLKLAFSTSRLKDKDDNFAGMALTLKDLTRASEITEKMQRADKLAALGGMAAGLAHEIRNPLGSIKGLTQLLKEELKEGAKNYCESCARPYFLSGLAHLENYRVSKDNHSLIKAEQELIEAVRRNPNDMGAYLKLADAKNLMKKFPEAKELYKKATKDPRFRSLAMARYLSLIKKQKAKRL